MTSFTVTPEKETLLCQSGKDVTKANKVMLHFLSGLKVDEEERMGRRAERRTKRRTRRRRRR